MADVKISALPAATTPLDGTELAPIVQSGTTKRVTVANLTVGRALTASSLTLTTPLSVANGGTGITSFGAGVATALGNAVNGASGICVQDASGRLGIGETAPAFSLDVKSTTDMSGRFRTTGTTNAASFYLTSGNGTTSGKYAYARFLNDDTNQQEWRLGTYGDNNFSLYNAKASSFAFVVDASGNLLVGTTSSIGSANVVATKGYISKSVALTTNGTSTVTVPNGSICIMISDGFPGDSAVFSLKSEGGSQGAYVLSQGTAGNIGFGTTSNPSTGTRLNVWVSAANTLSIQDVGQGARTMYLTFISTGG